MFTPQKKKTIEKDYWPLGDIPMNKYGTIGQKVWTPLA